MIEYCMDFWMLICICNEHFEEWILAPDQGRFLLDSLHRFQVSIPNQLVLNIPYLNTSIATLGDAVSKSGKRPLVQLVEDFLVQYYL